ncbi:MAG: hypothetical protein AXW15_05075 [Neptuniibacter sp. Phe_28]|nr:MAG: hypothetical protein AXW15_05075 [Neptuniibacter sp. Phe_28]
MKKSGHLAYLLVTLIAITWGQLAMAEKPLNTSANLPTTSTGLTFEVDPEVIKAKAREGQFLPIPMLKTPIAYKTFLKMYAEHLKKKKGGIHIAVIVDANNKNWPNKETTMHINNVYNFAKQAMTGNKKAQQRGYAELYGARINKIIPVVYEPKNQKSVSKKMANGQYETKNVPIALNDIILLVNDYRAVEKGNGAFINTIDELKISLETFLKDGRYMISKAQYLEELRIRIDELDTDLEELYKHRKELKTLKELLPHINEH